ncbi:MAG: endolytic transglycosylase MltG [Candidatus Gracilibacteria bacterium]
MEKRLLQLLGLALFIVAVWQVWQPLWRYDLNESVDKDSTEKIVFEITQGESAKSIGDRLEDKGLIGNDTSFIRTVKNEDLDGLVRYGSFVLSPSMTLRDIVTTLTTEGSGEMAITVIEGWTIDHIDAKLTDMSLINSGDFKLCTFNCTFTYDFLGNDRSLEGFLFPDTYFITSKNFSSEDLINRMLQNFDNRWTDEMDTTLASSGRTLREVVTVASMLEKEVKTAGDLPIVSGIIWKRLDSEWALGIDATLLYIQDDGEISAEDLASESEYNTRLNKGLPPTAIGNPGLATLEASLSPRDSDYWFYLTDPKTDAVIYATSNEEHEANKATYL